MAAPSSLNDLVSVRNLQPQAVELDYIRARLWPHTPLSAALSARLPFYDTGATTIVLYNNHGKHDPQGFVQARLRRARPEADICCISPALDSHPDAVTIWYRLLSEVTNAVCERGCQRVYAQAPSDGDIEQVLHQAGFTVYTHEDIYLLSGERISSFSRPAGPRLLRRQRSRDSWNLLRLYQATTPRPVQQAEGMVSAEGKLGPLGDWWEQATGTGYVLDSSDMMLAGAARLARGRAANWLRLYLHPDSQAQAGELVCGALALINTAHPRPVYCAVRDYEGGIRVPLEEAGFEFQFKRSLLVKHTTVRVKEPALWAVPVLEKPAPIVRTHTRADPLEYKHTGP